jgi:hypothetical protein
MPKQGEYARVMKSKSLPILAGAALMLAAGLGTSASATIVTTSPGPSPLSVAGVSGIDSLTFSPTPATTVKVLTGGDLPGNQDPSTIAASISTVFGVPTPTLTLNDESLTNPFTDSVPLGFNYAAIHQDSGEIIFFYNASQTTFTLNAFNNGAEAGALSNARFYSSVPAPEIGHGLLVLLAVGGVLFGGKFLEGLKKHRLNAA